MEVVYPTIAISDRLVLDDGSRPVEVLFLDGGPATASGISSSTCRASTRGDRGRPGDRGRCRWSAPRRTRRIFATTLTRLLDLKPAVIVPGHGPVMRDDATACARSRGCWRRSGFGTAAAVARGETSSSRRSRKSVDLMPSTRRAISGRPVLRRFASENYVVEPAIAGRLPGGRALRPRGTPYAVLRKMLMG